MDWLVVAAIVVAIFAVGGAVRLATPNVTTQIGRPISDLPRGVRAGCWSPRSRESQRPILAPFDWLGISFARSRRLSGGHPDTDVFRSPRRHGGVRNVVHLA